MKVAILEDERPALEHLRAALLRCQPTAEVVLACATVREALAWFRSNPAPDLVLADIELADGKSLALFEKVRVSCPVVFCTAYDAYVARAFSCNGIDYLLKPVDDAALGAALARYRGLAEHFESRLGAAASALGAGAPSYRERILGRRGDALVAIAVESLAYLAVEDGVVIAVDRDGDRYRVDGSLGDLEAELDPALYFRVNRQLLVRSSAVRGFRPYVKGRLLLELEPPRSDVVVSQANAGAFRAWLDR